MRTNHEYYQSLFPDLVTGNIDPRERQDLEVHLASCDECSHRLAEVRELAGIIGRPQPPRPPANYFSTVLPRIRERLDGKRARREDPLIARIAAPLAALAVVVAFFIQAPFTKEAGLRSVLSKLKTDELADVVVEQAEHQSLYLVPSTESLASALSDEAIDEKLADAILADENASLVAVSDLSEEDVQVILERLGERKIL